jgi:hypothetical protein
MGSVVAVEPTLVDPGDRGLCSGSPTVLTAAGVLSEKQFRTFVSAMDLRGTSATERAGTGGIETSDS